MPPPWLQPRIFVVDRDGGGRDGPDRLAHLRDSRRPADLYGRSQVDDFLRLGLRLLRRPDRRTARRIPRFAPVSNRVRRDRRTCAAWRWRSARPSAASDASFPATATGACLPPCRGRWLIRSAIVGWSARHGAQARRPLPSWCRATSHGVRVHPAPVYETILYLGVFAILWSMRKTSHPAGRIIAWYLMLAGARALPRRVLANQSASLLRSQRGATDCVRHDGHRRRAADSHAGKRSCGERYQPGEKESRPAMKRREPELRCKSGTESSTSSPPSSW